MVIAVQADSAVEVLFKRHVLDALVNRQVRFSFGRIGFFFEVEEARNTPLNRLANNCEIPAWPIKQRIDIHSEMSDHECNALPATWTHLSQKRGDLLG